MKGKKKIINILSGVAAVLLFLSACEKEISLDLPAVEKKIVIQGSIEQGQFPLVIISTNSPYFAHVDSASLMDMIIRNAEVTVSDGPVTEKLSMTIIPFFPFLAYEGDTIKGIVGHTYNLSVKIGTSVFTATTTITPPDRLDSIWFKPDDTMGDTLGYLWATYSGDQSVIKYYRGYAKRVNKDNRFIPFFGSMFDGQFLAGQTYTFYMMRGIDNYYVDEFTDQEEKEFGYFKVGDTVVVKICTMDKVHYDFWKAIEKDMFSGGSPFGIPATVPTNIQGGALGIWGGFGATYDTIYAKR